MSEPSLPFTQSPSQVLAALGSDPANGLGAAEVQRRLAASGPNSLTAAPPRRWWVGLAAQFNQLVIWILIAAALISGLLSDWTDAVAILAIVILNALLGYFQEERAAAALAALRNLASPAARVIRDSQPVTVPARDIVPGDILQLEAGDRVPADARLLSSISLTVQESTLTGESMPVEKDAQAVLPAPPRSRNDRIWCIRGPQLPPARGRRSSRRPECKPSWVGLPACCSTFRPSRPLCSGGWRNWDGC